MSSIYDKHFLSKSLFIRGRQCHKSLWLQKNRPKLKDEISASQEAAINTGFAVGDLAKGLSREVRKFLTKV